jgi:hypothetical protein
MLCTERTGPEPNSIPPSPIVILPPFILCGRRRTLVRRCLPSPTSFFSTRRGRSHPSCPPTPRPLSPLSLPAAVRVSHLGTPFLYPRRIASSAHDLSDSLCVCVCGLPHQRPVDTSFPFSGPTHNLNTQPLGRRPSTNPTTIRCELLLYGFDTYVTFSPSSSPTPEPIDYETHGPHERRGRRRRRTSTTGWLPTYLSCCCLLEVPNGAPPFSHHHVPSTPPKNKHHVAHSTTTPRNPPSTIAPGLCDALFLSTSRHSTEMPIRHER